MDQQLRDGAVGYNAGNQYQLPPRNNNRVAGRSFPSLAIVEARRDVKRALLIATLEIKRDNPGQTADFAWTLLQDRLVRETVVERHSEIQQIWDFAFNQPARPHFQSLYQTDLNEAESLWYSL